MDPIFIIVILPPLFAVTAWTVITVARICLPERPLPFGNDPAWLHQQALVRSEGELVGARDIRDEHRRLMRVRPPVPYIYGTLPGRSSGFPGVWADDLWFRRN